MQAYLRLLTHQNLQRIVDAMGMLYKPVPQHELAGHFTAIMKALIPGDFHGVSVVLRPKNASETARRYLSLYPVPAHLEDLADIFSKYYPKYPLRPIRESGNLAEPLALSDIESWAKIERLDLYHDFYSVLGVKDDLSVNFGTQNHRVCLAVLRGRRGFSDQDRAVLAVLNFHLERAYRYSRMLEELRTDPPGGMQSIRPALGATDSFEDLGGNPQTLCALGLSGREAEVLYWVAAGKSSPVISTILGIRHDTVRAHLKSIYAKLGVENRLSAALRALQVLRAARRAVTH